MSEGVLLSRFLESFISVLVFKSVGQRSTAKNYYPVSEIFEKRTNNRTADYLEKCILFSDFKYGFRSSRSTTDLLTVASNRIARGFNRSGATRAVALDIFNLFDRVWHTGLLHKHKFMEFQVRYLALFLLFLVK